MICLTTGVSHLYSYPLKYLKFAIEIWWICILPLFAIMNVRSHINCDID